MGCIDRPGQRHSPLRLRRVGSEYSRNIRRMLQTMPDLSTAVFSLSAKPGEVKKAGAAGARTGRAVLGNGR